MGKHAMARADAAWLRMDSPTNLMVVNSVLWFDQPVELKSVRKVVQERIVDVFPRFRQIAVEPPPPRSPHWDDDENFDLDLHLHHIALPEPGDDDALRTLMGDLMSQPLDRTKPLWHIYLIDNYGAGAAIVSRIHHAVADGISLARVMMTTTDPAPGARRPRRQPFAESKRPARLGFARAASGRLLHEGFESLLHPRGAAALASNAAHELGGDARALAKLLFTGHDADTVLRGPLIPQNRVAWSDAFPLDDIKAIGRRYDATVNDVLVAAVSGALARYLARHGTSGEQIRAMVPFNLRPLDEPIDPALGNHFALVVLPLPTNLARPAERIVAAKREMDAIKRSREPAVAFGILSLLGFSPSQVEQFGVGIVADETSLVLTNVPGPPEPVFFAGSRVAGALPWAPCAGSLGMTVTIFSYAGGVRVGFMTDAQRVPDPDRLARAFAAELKALARWHQPSSTPT
jgi:diacylglycerol O-acyltransferase / wax synthase